MSECIINKCDFGYVVGGFNMLIDLSELLSTEHKKQDVEANIEMDKFKTKQGCYDFVRKEPVHIHLENAGKKKLLLTAHGHIALNMPCDRCLTNVKKDFDIDISKRIDMSRPFEDTEDIDEFSYIEDGNLNVDKLVYNEILVNLPMKVLCSENCKGICNRCGANLNSQTCDCDRTELDPRMSKILDVFNNFKEV